MNYLGSGYLSLLFKEEESNNNKSNMIVIGRRIGRMRLHDFKYIFKNECIFLDTLDIGSLEKFSFKWFLNPYRIEKAITYRILKILCKKLIRVHVPIITDSNAWKKLQSDDSGVLLSGFSYSSLYKILHIISSKNNYKYRSSDLYNLSLKLNIELDYINALDCFTSRLVESVKKT